MYIIWSRSHYHSFPFSSSESCTSHYIVIQPESSIYRCNLIIKPCASSICRTKRGHHDWSLIIQGWSKVKNLPALNSNDRKPQKSIWRHWLRYFLLPMYIAPWIAWVFDRQYYFLVDTHAAQLSLNAVGQHKLVQWWRIDAWLLSLYDPIYSPIHVIPVK